MNGCENKADVRINESSKAQSKMPGGLRELLGIFEALGPFPEDSPPVNTLEIEDFVNEFDCKLGSMPDNLDCVVMPMEDFEKFWGAARNATRSDIISKYAKPKIPAYTERNALDTVFSAARKAKMDAFIAQHGCRVFNTYDAWQKLGFQVCQGESGQKVYSELNTIVIFGVNQTIAKVPSVLLSDMQCVIAEFCNTNGIWGVAAIKAAYPWTNKYFIGDVLRQQRNIRETGEII